MFVTRNIEFFRDRSAMGWNFMFPFLIVVGFGIMFADKDYTEYKVGVYLSAEHQTKKDAEGYLVDVAALNIVQGLKSARYIRFVGFNDFNEALNRLKHHKIDFLVKNEDPSNRYWVTNDSPKGYVVEKIFQAGLVSQTIENSALKQAIKGAEIRYIDWMFPGVLGMNMMFSALFGVGYMIVLYRKNGVLKRLKATPLTAFEYLAAQMLSRIFLLMFTIVIVWIGCDAIFSFQMEGSFIVLMIVFFVGGLSLTSIGLMFASRGISEEFTSGILNFIAWPMMFLSEVWFSIEGAPNWVKMFAKIFPLTHLLSAARKVMNDGAGLAQVTPEIIIMLLMSLTGLMIGAYLFTWSKN